MFHCKLNIFWGFWTEEGFSISSLQTNLVFSSLQSKRGWHFKMSLSALGGILLFLTQSEPAPLLRCSLLGLPVSSSVILTSASRSQWTNMCVKCYCLNLPAEKTKTPEIISAPRAALSCRTKTLPRRPPRVQLRAFTPSPCVASGGPVPPACSSRLPQPSWSREAHQSSRALTGSASSIWETLGLCACTLGGTSLGALL